METPNTSSQVAPPTSKSSQVVLGLFAIASIALMVYRGYGNTLWTRPTTYDGNSFRYRVDLNRADQAELRQVPGIGEQLGDAIVQHRVQYGAFSAIDSLDDVRGIGPKTVEKLRPWVQVHQQVSSNNHADWRVQDFGDSPPEKPAKKITDGEPPIDLNQADERTLQRLPGIGPTLAHRIVVARGVERFQSPEDLTRVKGIGSKTIHAIKPFVVCKSDN